MMRFRAEGSRFVLRALALALCLTLAGGCSPDLGPHLFTRFAMGTVVDYTVVGVEHDEARSAVNAAHEEIERISRLLWEETETSEVHDLNDACSGGAVGEPCRQISVSDETGRFLERAIAYQMETDGAFDVTVGAFLPFYRFGIDPPVAPDSAAIQKLLDHLGQRHLRVRVDGLDSLTLTGMRRGIRVSVGGIAKGYAVDRAIAVLRQAGIENALLNAGGDLYGLGTNLGEPWRIGIRDPDKPNGVIASLNISNAAVATSGDYQRYFEVDGVRYHHLLDPATGFPARRVRSATVITAVSTERADALATGLFIAGRAGLEMIERLSGAEGLVVEASGRTYQTSGMVQYEVMQ